VLVRGAADAGRAKARRALGRGPHVRTGRGPEVRTGRGPEVRTGRGPEVPQRADSGTRVTAAMCVVVVLLLLLLSACARPATPLTERPLPTATELAPIALPRDAQPHDVLTEWWYFTGHLTTDQDAREYGFEFTIFQARRQNAPTGYLAHFAVTDVDGQRFSHQARVAQGEERTAFPLDVAGWTLDEVGGTHTIEAQMEPEPGAEQPYALRLVVSDEKPPAIHHGGVIDYGAAGRSYYYSQTRLGVQGDLRAADGVSRVVTGQAWMDHQWGDFIVPDSGWDWYSLQFDDRTELMLYVLRGAPASAASSVYGTQVLADGSARDVAPGSITSTPLGTWTSPHTGAAYPSGWRLTLPNGDTVHLEPVLADQELFFPGFGGMAYWEGAVRVEGDRRGVGYVELTGYAGR
jgi:predicted secreted hydrolase